MIENFTVLDGLGVIGSFLIAGAYFAVSSKKLDAEKPPFHYLNLAGAVLILASLYVRPNAGAIMIEVLWVAIGLFALAKYFLKNR